MHISHDTVDDLLHELFEEILEKGEDDQSTKGAYKEIPGCFLTLTNPLNRISKSELKGTIFSCLGELFWYLSGKNDLDFIAHYIHHYKESSENDGTIWGAYGPRIYNMQNKYNQLESVINKLVSKRSTRQAVILLLDAGDISFQHKDTPCTISLQFIIRKNKLSMFTFMRSNDAYKGLPHDIFVFTMLQEIISKILNCDLGSYNHFVSSMHIYKEDIDKVNKFIKEGYMSSRVIMPPMPEINFLSIKDLILEAEEQSRTNLKLEVDKYNLPTYWKDLVLLLHYYTLTKKENKLTYKEEAEKIKHHISHSDYSIFIDKRNKGAN